MIKVYRKGIPIESLDTLNNASKELGGCRDLLRMHKNRKTHGFPKPVAYVNGSTLYIFKELEAFYNSVLWRQADKQINELKGGAA